MHLKVRFKIKYLNKELKKAGFETMNYRSAVIWAYRKTKRLWKENMKNEEINITQQI